MQSAKKFHVAFLMMLSACEAGTDETIADSVPTCENIREEVVEASKENDVMILKIYEPELVSQDDNVLSCKGTAFVSISDERQRIYYKMQTDEEGDSFIGYSGTPYPSN